jgi:hypothetical protein
LCRGTWRAAEFERAAFGIFAVIEGQVVCELTVLSHLPMAIDDARENYQIVWHETIFSYR